MEKQKSEFAQDDFSEMYSKLPNLVLAFHGCSKETFEHVIVKRQGLAKSENNLLPFDSVRGIFFEGDSVYPQSCFYEKTHIQICITNPNCIKGYFSPIQTNKKFSLP